MFITEFISTHKGFSGVIKQRYADFHVTEVMPNGNLAPFDSVEPPASDISALKARERRNQVLEYEQDKLHLLDQELTPEQVAALVELCNDPSKSHVIVPCSEDRDERTDFHELVRTVFPLLYSRTLTPTMDNEGKKRNTRSAQAGEEGYRLEITRDSTKDRREPGFRHEDRPNQGQYCHFSVCKVNMDTNACVRLIARKLRCRQKEIRWVSSLCLRKGGARKGNKTLPKHLPDVLFLVPCARVCVCVCAY